MMSTVLVVFANSIRQKTEIRGLPIRNTEKELLSATIRPENWLKYHWNEWMFT